VRIPFLLIADRRISLASVLGTSEWICCWPADLGLIEQASSSRLSGANRNGADSRSSSSSGAGSLPLPAVERLTHRASGAASLAAVSLRLTHRASGAASSNNRRRRSTSSPAASPSGASSNSHSSGAEVLPRVRHRLPP
jgi:hypothetical protein